MKAAMALVQLAAVGAQNMFLNSNPELSFFKDQMRTHSHFAMESRSITFNRDDVNIFDMTRLTCNIQRYGDLISDMYFCFTLPSLYYDAVRNVRPKWIRHVGETIVNNATVMIGGSVIGTCYGEWLSIYNSLTMPLSKLHIYNKMSGNDVECYDPDVLVNEVSATRPFVAGRRVVVPLNFWFTRNPGCALPLVSMQYEFVTVNIELRPVMDLFLVNVQGAGYVRPQSGNAAHQLANFNTTQVIQTTLGIAPYIEVNYVTLDDPERLRFIKESQDYLIEQTVRVEKDGVFGNTPLNISLQNPVKELVFVARDVRVRDTNEWTNFTNVDDGSDLIQSMTILFNGFERLANKPIEYFKYIQPFRYHSGSPLAGVCVYSFSLNPEDFQPSGECNMSKINQITLYVQIAPGVVCDVVVYAINYNFLRVTTGTAGIAFAL